MRRRTAAEVFPQSVASGDPEHRGIVLWTRVAPADPASPVAVIYEIAADRGFRHPVIVGETETGPERDHTVSVDVRDADLQPFTTYWYRFRAEGVTSRTGRLRTLPAPGSSPERIRLGYASCQDYTNGYFTALRFLAREPVDYVLHLGDYVYETTGAGFQHGGPPARCFSLPGGGARAQTLDDYRFLYRHYRSDPDLQRLHERHTVITLWDDHEFADDCYREFSTDTLDEQANRAPQRRKDANRAWAEYQPARVPYDPRKGPLDELRIYRSFAFGDLLELVLTDERLYRDGPPCGLAEPERYYTMGCGAERDPRRTMLGATQRAWLVERLTGSRARWKVWANETMLMQFKLLSWLARQVAARDDVPAAAGGIFLNLDQWDGYQAERAAIVRALKQAGTRNIVVLTGDLHTFIAGYIREDFDDPGEPPTAVCLMAGSVTASNLLELLLARGLPYAFGFDLSPLLRVSNPHFAFVNADTHGYNVVDVTPSELRCTMKSVTTVLRPNGLLRTLAAFRVPVDEVQLERLRP